MFEPRSHLSRPSLSRSALALILALSLSGFGCTICVLGLPDDVAVAEVEPAGPAGLGTLFDVACVDPVSFLFLMLMGLAVPADEIYTPGAFLGSEGKGQTATPGGHVALTVNSQGAVTSTQTASSELQAFDAVLEPLGSAARRLPADSGAPAVRRVFLSDADGQNVFVVDPSTNQVVSRIRVGSDPHGLAFSPDGATLYVANRGSGSISVVDVATLTATGSLPLPGGGSPEGLALTPDGATLYAVNNIDAGTLIVFDLAAGAAKTSVRVGRQPKRVRVSPDGSLAFIANFGANNVSVLDTRTNTLIAALNADKPADLAVSGDGNRLYVVSAGSVGKVLEFSVSTLQATRSWQVGDTPTAMQLLPDGLTLAVTNRMSAFVSLVSLPGQGEVLNVPAPTGLGPIAITAPASQPSLAQ